MRFKRSRRELLNDIVESVDHVQEFVGSLDFVDYLESELVSSAVERKLLIISEAAVRLGKQIESDCPGQDWRAIRGIGNVLRHHYEGVDHEQVWEAIKENLPGLKRAVLLLMDERTA